jgi:hypothetical protein
VRGDELDGLPTHPVLRLLISAIAAASAVENVLPAAVTS